MVDVLGRRPAVLTAVPVTDEDGPPGQRRPGPEGHADEVDEPDDGRHGEGHALGVQLLVAMLQHLGLLLQHEDHSPAHRHDTERLVGGVEHQRSPQAPPSSSTGRRRTQGLVAPAARRRVADHKFTRASVRSPVRG